MSFYKTIAEFGVAVAAQVVDGVNAILELEDGNVLALRCHGHARAFKQIGLGGHVNPVVHDQMG